jgi:hypothetical protein
MLWKYKKCYSESNDAIIEPIDVEVISSIVGSCSSCWEVLVKVPVGKTYNVIITSSFTSPAIYASCTVNSIFTNINENITTNKTYSIGIDAANLTANLQSTISVEVIDTTISTQIFNQQFIRNHGNAIC